MKLAIGIDTGGTYTDAVLYDFDLSEVIAKGKSLTTKQNLEEGIGNALDLLPKELLKKAVLICLSTTLATNACVEHKGSRAKLILLGTTDSVLEWIKADSTYGIKPEDVLCIDNSGSYDGTVIDYPDWEKIIGENAEWFSDAQALAAAEVYAIHNGGACEKDAKEKLNKKYKVPFVTGSELAGGLNIMERGSTAWLNAKLLTTIDEFMTAVKAALAERGLDVKQMIVRSDGSLMSEKAALTYPVKTILSGPAASIVGGKALSGCENSLIIDMGGTTTDISIVKNAHPLSTGGIRIGEYRTQIPGVFIDTFGLGGDSRVLISENRPTLSSGRVQPLCIAAREFPEIKKELKALLKVAGRTNKPLHEFLYLIREPKCLSEYNDSEIELIQKLKAHPIMLGSGEINLNYLRSERLETEGVVMRCGITPTDFMHIRGDFTLHDTEASILGARCLLKALPDYSDTEASLEKLSEDVYELVCKKLYENVVRVMLTNEYPKAFEESISPQVLEVIARSWDKPDFFNISFKTKASLIGIGAPTHIFLPRVAKALGSEYVIPPHAEVANALGAVIADISATAKVQMLPNRSGTGSNFFVYTREGIEMFEKRSDALNFAKKTAQAYAEAEARELGALGQLSVNVSTDEETVYAKNGAQVDFGAVAVAKASGRVEE